MSLDALLHRKTPSLWEQFVAAPSLFIARRALLKYKFTSPLNTIRIVCISDTHNQHKSISHIPDGDVLIHAGDLTQSGTSVEMHDALQWMNSQPHTHKLYIAGNHDRCMDNVVEREQIEAAYPGLTYLQGSSISISIRGRCLNVFGSPLTPKHGSWPFQYPRNPSPDIWSTIPITTDILITHGPPAYYLDLGAGCKALLSALWNVRPLLHVFGHIHAGRGTTGLAWTGAQASYELIASGRGKWTTVLSFFFSTFWSFLGRRRVERHTMLVNASTVGGFRDEIVNCPIVVDI